MVVSGGRRRGQGCQKLVRDPGGQAVTSARLNATVRAVLSVCKTAFTGQFGVAGKLGLGTVVTGAEIFASSEGLWQWLAVPLAARLGVSTGGIAMAISAWLNTSRPCLTGRHRGRMAAHLLL